jgi:hypothetical protein
MSTQNAWARIADKLAALRRADPGLEVYGASTHRYHLNPPLSEREVLAFEARARVTVPNEYRAYLLEFANGGAGPDNGVFPLDLSRDLDAWRLDEPFPVPTELAREVISRPQGKRFLEGFEGDELPGCMELSDGGCGIMAFLVFAGEQRGIVWYSGAYNELHPSASDTGAQVGFLAWYEEWLDKRLAPAAVGRWRSLCL